MKIKRNTSHPILLIEPSLSPIENISMTGYLIYENKITNMGYKMLHNIDPNSSQNHPHLKQAWHNDVNSRIDHLTANYARMRKGNSCLLRKGVPFIWDEFV
jgi:hypothetical protein